MSKCRVKNNKKTTKKPCSAIDHGILCTFKSFFPPDFVIHPLESMHDKLFRPSPQKKNNNKKTKTKKTHILLPNIYSLDQNSRQFSICILYLFFLPLSLSFFTSVLKNKHIVIDCSVPHEIYIRTLCKI